MPKVPLPPAESMQLDSLAEVARGGMGSVELARVIEGRNKGQILAVKRLHANIAEDPEFVSMFLDEAWMTAALKHPNVAQVVAWGNDDKGMFLAIELVQGVSLSRLLKEAQQNQEPFAERTVAFICSQLCAGLVAAHTLTAPDGSALGLVHRDLTPANVLISFEGVVKIIDFGIAKAEERISHTRTGQLKGKPAYMAPEQQRGGLVDARADLFAFGVLMFEMLAGRRPWTARGAFDVMMEISNDPHPDLGELRRGLNPEFVAIAHKCLAKKPDDRFSTAGEIKERLDAWLHAKGFSADDHYSLAQFILRNSQPQVLWWQEALRGEHSKKKAPTFKELEERIDEERERKSKGAARRGSVAPQRPAAGTMPVQRPPNPLGGTVPMQAFRGPSSSSAPDSNTPPSSGPVSSGQQIPPSSGNSAMMGVAPSPLAPAGPSQYPTQPPTPGANFGSGKYATLQPASSSFGAPQYATPPPPAVTGARFGSGQYAPTSAKPVGTEFMAVAPFTQQPPQQAPEQSPPAFPPGTPTQSPHHVPYAMSAPAPTLDHTLNDPGGIPMGPAMPLPSMTQPISPAALALLGLPGPTQTPYAAIRSTQDRSSRASAPPPARRSRVPVILALLVLLLGGTGAGLWFFGDSIGLNLGQWGPRAPVKPR